MIKHFKNILTLILYLLKMNELSVCINGKHLTHTENNSFEQTGLPFAD